MLSSAGANAAIAKRVSELSTPGEQRDEADEQQIGEGPAGELDGELDLARAPPCSPAATIASTPGMKISKTTVTTSSAGMNTARISLEKASASS